MELGFFVDDERTMTTLPEKLAAQADLAKAIGQDLFALGKHCSAKAKGSSVSGQSRGGRGGRGAGAHGRGIWARDTAGTVRKRPQTTVENSR